MNRIGKIVFLGTLVLGSVFTVSSQITAIRAGKVVDPATGTVANNQIILIEGQDIKAIGADVQIPAGAKVIDLSKQTVMPGMMDAHTHLCMNLQHQRDAGRYYITTLLDSNSMRSIQGTVNAKSMLEYGFTTIRDVGNEGNYACVEVRRAVEQELIPGPTMITAGRIIAPYGGQFHLQQDKQDLGTPEYAFADTRDEMRKAIRENLHYGARVIKIVVDDQRYIYSVDDIKFMIEEAHDAGVKLAAHCWTERGALRAAQAGVDSIEHAVRISDEALAIAKQKGIPIVPIPFTEIDAVLSGEPGSNKESDQKMFADPVRRALKMGVTMVWGPDVIFSTKEYPRGRLSIDTVDNWVEAGIPANIILQALTTNPAKLLGVDKDRGALKAGMKADIVAMADNPLEKITTVKNVTFVMRNGKVYKQN
ncbi:MAG TPA: amidohydrolase family protein [Pyrinomonadaceae bacterium]|jgi:imidazolonepropionase-like amidohydrolase|nr:amidohydrolase family protein [Pyrinomonadaceae bacterium]